MVLPRPSPPASLWRATLRAPSDLLDVLHPHDLRALCTSDFQTKGLSWAVVAIIDVKCAPILIATFGALPEGEALPEIVALPDCEETILVR